MPELSFWLCSAGVCQLLLEGRRVGGADGGGGREGAHVAVRQVHCLAQHLVDVVI